MYKTIIGVLEGQTDNTRKVCENIKKKDSTFGYKIIKPGVESLKDKFESLLIIYSQTEEEGNRRGGWFIHKCTNAKLSDYFWVKKD
jgi:hypothetical protein